MRRAVLLGGLVGLLALPASSYAQGSSSSSSPSPSSAEQASPPAGQAARADNASVNGNAGPCTADFVVNDAAGKGIYNVKVEIEVRYGFFGAHHVGLTINTDSQGKARMEGLPDKIKGTAEFKLSYENQTKSLPYDPFADCHPHHQVVFGEK